MFTSPLSFHAATERSFIISFTSTSLHTREPISTSAICFLFLTSEATTRAPNMFSRTTRIRGLHEITPQSERLDRTGARRALDSMPTGLFTMRGRKIFRETYICLPSIRPSILRRQETVMDSPISRSGSSFFHSIHFFVHSGKEWGGFFDTLFLFWFCLATFFRISLSFFFSFLL
jgi:hypothetical protein